MATYTVKKGFSLIEIMVAVAIMGLLAMVATQFVGGQLKKSKVSATEATLQATDGAIEMYHLDTNKYPETLSDLSRKPYDENSAQKWSGPYFKQALKNADYFPTDGWGVEIQYNQNDSGASTPYELYSFGPNGEDAPEEEWIHAK